MKTWPDFGLGACLAASDCWLTMIFSLFELFVQIHWAGWTITVPVQIPGQGILDSLPSIQLSVSPSSAVTAPFLLNFFTSLSLSLQQVFTKYLTLLMLALNACPIRCSGLGGWPFCKKKRMLLSLNYYAEHATANRAPVHTSYTGEADTGSSTLAKKT